ncbi:uncharacterized protein LOC143769875 [Ranitomeya variabilis]|uniref:uncharacterized protein LOC143769875 n=1 Tax=Ranitomeya variabilis TaxID=490064 RepID=UPI0040570FA6
MAPSNQKAAQKLQDENLFQNLLIIRIQKETSPNMAPSNQKAAQKLQDENLFQNLLIISERSLMWTLGQCICPPWDKGVKTTDIEEYVFHVNAVSRHLYSQLEVFQRNQVMPVGVSILWIHLLEKKRKVMTKTSQQQMYDSDLRP